jgi:Uma2 family endonuclease
MPFPATAAKMTAERYLGMVESGLIGPGERVELLEGVIVATSAQNPRHASAITRADGALRKAVAQRAVVRVQLPLITGPRSVPEPDLAVVPGSERDYDDAHPARALLVVEIADSSLLQDRLSKPAIYAAAGVPEYWLVNLRDGCVEVFRGVRRKAARYVRSTIARRGDRLELVALAEASVAVDDLLPGK